MTHSFEDDSTKKPKSQRGDLGKDKDLQGPVLKKGIGEKQER